ncbi:tRNA pseudouridine(54/55) synthase Pus10, partial [Candidatus Bathyarchaeota archaeon]
MEEALLEKALSMLSKYALCDSCLGRQCALLGYGLSNTERGRAIKTVLFLAAHARVLEGDEEALRTIVILASNGFFRPARAFLEKQGREVPPPPARCYLCGGLTGKVQELVLRALEALEPYEFSNFLVGIELPPDVEEREDAFRAEFGISHAEALRNELSREIGKAISSRLGVPVEFKRPDVLVLIRPLEGRVEVQANPVFVAGRYRKLVRGIPQAKWVCTRCGGRGCPRCGWTGKMYPTSVSELICGPVLEFFQGEDAAFHAAGREDIDARMLGPGRPFVVEVKRPKKRSVDLRALEDEINRRAGGLVAVSGLRYVDRGFVRRIKMEEAEKVYEVLVKFDRPVSDEELSELEEAFSGIVIRQRTPLRVLHRRADKVRVRSVRELRVIERLAPDKVRLRIRCDGGLYVKELVTGDEGRTRPSISEFIKAGAQVLELDVVDVLM